MVNMKIINEENRTLFMTDNQYEKLEKGMTIDKMKDDIERSDIKYIIQKAENNGALKIDPNAFYSVLIRLDKGWRNVSKIILGKNIKNINYDEGYDYEDVANTPHQHTCYMFEIIKLPN